jgi:2-C-methyl-D-erythritol 4-phosphate cytidylyltransferase
MQVSAIIVAAGSGKRLGSPLAKAFVPLAGHPLLFYALRTLSEVASIAEVVLTVPAGMKKAARSVVNESGLEIPVKITEGGKERQDSVRIALALTSAESALAIVHDAARPFAPASLFYRCIERAAANGAAIAAIPVVDTLKRVADGRIAATVSRTDLWQAQTPQAFARKLLIRAHEEAMSGRIAATDDADLVARLGHHAEVIEGSPANLKITTSEDLMMAEALAARLFPR